MTITEKETLNPFTPNSKGNAVIFIETTDPNEPSESTRNRVGLVSEDDADQLREEMDGKTDWKSQGKGKWKWRRNP